MPPKKTSSVSQNAKAMLENFRNHTSSRHRQETNRYVPPPIGNIADIVDDLLSMPTREETLFAKLDSKLRKQPEESEDSDDLDEDIDDGSSLQEQKKIARQATKLVTATRMPSKQSRGSGPPIEEIRAPLRWNSAGANKSGKDLQEVSPPGSRNSSGGGQARGKSNTQDDRDVHSVSSTDIQSEKARRRVEDADSRRSQNDSNAIINYYKTKYLSAKEKNRQKNQQLDELDADIRTLSSQYENLENDNAKLKATLLHVRNNPEQLVQDILKKRGSRASKAKRIVDSENGLAPAVRSAYYSSGNDAVKTVYRTFKFINNDEQENMFHMAVMNHLGKQELMYLADDTDERKAKVDDLRKKTRDDFGTYWVGQLNVHRTYVQVSSQHLTFIDLKNKILTSCSHFLTYIEPVQKRSLRVDVDEQR